jgi:catechol 2,3-dioxygenase-like lactoylglutathione lyase family enzyme
MARIRHLAILTEDVERLVKFYTNSFGLNVVKGVGTATYLTDGHINLAIIPIGPERKDRGQSPEGGHQPFRFRGGERRCHGPRLQTVGRIDGVEKRPPDREAEYRVYDPDGNPIDLSQHGWPH